MSNLVFGKKKNSPRLRLLMTEESTRTVSLAWAIMLKRDPDHAPSDKTACVSRLVDIAYKQLKNEEEEK